MEPICRFTDHLAAVPPADRKADRTVQRITLAVAQLLEEIDIEALSVSMIAQRADIAHGTVYRYFDGKSAVVAHTLDVYFRFVGRQLISPGPGASAYERIYCANLAYTYCFRANVGLMRCHFHMKDRDDRIAQIGSDANDRLVTRVVRRWLLEHGGPAGPRGAPHQALARLSGSTDSQEQLVYLRLAVHALLGMADDLLLRIYGRNQSPLGDLGDNVEAIARTISDIWWRALDNDAVAIVTAADTAARRVLS